MNKPISTGPADDPDNDLPVPEPTARSGEAPPAGSPEVETGPIPEDYEPL
jgi:hypothetical protein